MRNGKAKKKAEAQQYCCYLLPKFQDEWKLANRTTTTTTTTTTLLYNIVLKVFEARSRHVCFYFQW